MSLAREAKKSRLEILSRDSVLRAKGEMVCREERGKKFKVGVRFTEMSQKALESLEEVGGSARRV